MLTKSVLLSKMPLIQRLAVYGAVMHDVQKLLKLTYPFLLPAQKVSQIVGHFDKRVYAADTAFFQIFKQQKSREPNILFSKTSM